MIAIDPRRAGLLGVAKIALAIEEIMKVRVDVRTPGDLSESFRARSHGRSAAYMTTKKELRGPDYSLHILQALIQIETYVAGVDRAVFFGSPLLQDAIIRNVEIIGEAASRHLQLDSEFDRRHPDMALKAAYGMRNSLSHGYFQVDPVLVWGMVQTDIPVLKKQVLDVLETYPQPLS